MHKPTAEQLDQQLRLEPGTITFERTLEQPADDDRFRILATLEDDGHGNWRVDLRPAWP